MKADAIFKKRPEAAGELHDVVQKYGDALSLLQAIQQDGGTAERIKKSLRAKAEQVGLIFSRWLSLSPSPSCSHPNSDHHAGRY